MSIASSPRNVYVVEVVPAIDAAGTTTTFLFSTEGWATLPTDTPANTLVKARLDQPGNFRRELFSGNRTVGAVRPSFGECTLINSDGDLDIFAKYGFDGREFKLSYGPVGGAYPSDFTVLLKASLRGATFDLKRVKLIIRDRMEILDRPLSQSVFAGTGNEEGTTELTGKRKPLAFGNIRSMKPQLLDQNSLLYSIGAPPTGKEALALYTTDGQGGLLSYATGQTPPLASFASSVNDLVTATIDPGYYWMYPPLGLLRVGSQPAFDLTTGVTVNNPSGGALQAELGTLLSQMATAAGITTADSGDIAAVDSAKDNIYGYSLNSDETALSAMSKLASSALCWFGMGADDVLHMGVLATPTGTPVVTLRSHDFTAIEKLDGGDTNRLIPIWRATAQCSTNYATQSSFATSATQLEKSWAETMWPGKVVSSDSSVKNKHPYADEMTVDVYGGTNLTGDPNTDGSAASTAMALYGVDRELIQVSLPLRPEIFSLMEIGSVVEIIFPRYSWDSGKKFIVVAIDADFNANKYSLTLWG